MLHSNTPMHQRAAGVQDQLHLHLLSGEQEAYGEIMQQLFQEVEDSLPPLLLKESTKMARLRPRIVPEKKSILVISPQKKDFQKIKSYASYGHGQSGTWTGPCGVDPLRNGGSGIDSLQKSSNNVDQSSTRQLEE